MGNSDPKFPSKQLSAAAIEWLWDVYGFLFGNEKTLITLGITTELANTSLPTHEGDLAALKRRLLKHFEPAVVSTILDTTKGNLPQLAEKAKFHKMFINPVASEIIGYFEFAKLRARVWEPVSRSLSILRLSQDLKSLDLLPKRSR